MMLEHPPLLIFQFPVKLNMKKSNPTMFGNMPLISYLNFLHFTLMGKASEYGSNIKTWMMWNNFTNGMRNIWQFGELSSPYFENSWDKGNPELLKTNLIKKLHMLWNYLHHLVREVQESSIPGNPFSILLSDQFCNLTWKEFMTWRLQDSNQNTSLISNTGYQGQPKQESRHKSTQTAYELLAFKKSIMREVSQYTILKDEKYF